MAPRFLLPLLFAMVIATVTCNLEGDVLHAWKATLADPNNVLQSWDPTLVNPCTWYHVTCNGENAVTRLDLGDAGLSGPLIPQLGLLKSLQYLELFGNKISGSIPTALGNLTKLVSLDLYRNQLAGSIPVSLANLHSLRFLRLNSNKLTGKIPFGVINLVNTGNLIILNVSDNTLTGKVRPRNSKEFAITTLIQDPSRYQQPWGYACSCGFDN